jgi:hypothetical protein
MTTPAHFEEAAENVREEDVAEAVVCGPDRSAESDGTLDWDSITIVVVELEAGGERGLGYSYSHAATAAVIDSTLAPLVEGANPMAPPVIWRAMRHAVRNIVGQGIAAMALAAAI